MASIRDKYRKKIDVNKRKKQIAKEDSNLGTSFSDGDYIELKDGINYLRIMPEKDGDDNFYHPRKVHWMTFYKEEGSGTRRGTVFNAVTHGGFSKDPVEAYISILRDRCSDMAENGESKEAERILGILKDYRRTITPSITFMMYAIEIDKKSGTAGKISLFEAKTSIRNDINSINEDAFEEADEEITLDYITDPDEGCILKIKYNPDAKKSTDYYKTTKNDTYPLSDELLEQLDKMKTLTEKYSGVYNMSDFNLALEGLELFEEENDLDFLEDEEWLETVEAIKAEVEGGSSSGDSKKKKKATKKVEPEETDEDEEEEEEETDEEEEETDEYDEMSRKELKSFIKKNDLEITVFKSTEDDELRDKIRAAMEEEAEEESEEEEEEAEETDSELDDFKKKMKAKLKKKK